MDKIKKILALAFTLILSISMIPATNVSAAKKAKLNKTKATIYVGKTVTLTLKNNKNKVKWSSSNKKVATVNKKGKVKGKKAGKVTITAKVGKKKYKCRVTVKKRIVKQITPQINPQPVEQTTTKPTEQPTTKPAEQPTSSTIEEPTTNIDDYGDSGEDWIIKSTTNRCWIQEYVGNETNIVIPEKICGKTVVGIEEDAFRNNEKISSVIIPNSVTSIGDSAFYSCSNLTSVIIPNSVTSIGDYAFSYNKNIEEIAIPKNVEYVGENAFSFSDINTVYIPYYQSYGGTSFQSCKIEQVIYYEGTANIDLGEFVYSTVDKIVVPESTVNIEKTMYSYNMPIINNIVGISGSYAETWANENGYTFIAQ